MACMKRTAGVMAGLVALLLAEWTAQGAIYRRMSLDSLVQDSELVVYGRVIASRALWDPATATIWTRTEFLVIDGPKGQPGKSVTVTEPGGTVNGRGVVYPGTPQFRLEQECVLFLYRAAGNRLRVTGLLQGVYAVATDRTTGERWAQPVLPQPEIAYETGSQAAQTVKRLAAGPENLSQFLYTIRVKASNR
jgi:hypothetical protein